MTAESDALRRKLLGHRTNQDYDHLRRLSNSERGVEIFGPLNEQGYDHVHDDQCSCSRDEYAGAESDRLGYVDSIPELVDVIFGISNGDFSHYASYRQKLTVFPYVPLPEDTPPTALTILDRLTYILGAITFRTH